MKIDFFVTPLLRLAGAAIWMAVLPSLAQAAPRDEEVAAVNVYKEAGPSSVVYTYSVANKADRSLVGFTVGFDYYRGNPELSGSRPLSISSPAGWEGYVISLEESDKYEVRWDIKDPSVRLKPGQTLSGFKITARNDDLRFVNSNWTVVVDGPPSHASSRLLAVQAPPPSGDNVAPVIQLTVSPAKIWPPTRKMVEVIASVQATDDQDPNPTVKLVSITCSDCPEPAVDIQGASYGADDRQFSVRADRLGKRKEGRNYVVTYSATDKSGNSAAAQAHIRIPHDMKK